MSHHRKRVYPQAQYQIQQQQAAAAAAVSPNVGGAPGETSVLNQNGSTLYPQQATFQPQQNPMVGSTPMFTPAQQQLNQQVDQTAFAMGSMQLNNNNINSAVIPSYPQAQAQGAPQGMYPVQQQQGLYPGGQFSHSKPMNQLYPVDLLTELPPPIHDLTLPPPPLMIPPEKMIVPSNLANASPDFVRCTLNAMPKTNSLLKKSKLPLAIVVRPYQHLQDTVDSPPLTEDGVVVRCRRCRGYMNPFVTMIEQGRRWRCNFCRLANDIPMQYNHSYDGNQLNQYERNEIRYGVMEFLAPKEYSVRQPPPSTYAFILDVSQNAIRNGLLATTTRTILESLEFLPNHDGRTRISILCVDNAIHYFKIPRDDEEGQTIQVMDVADIDEPFLPRPNSMIVSLTACRKNIENLLNKIPEIFQYNVMTKFALGPSLKSAFNLIQGTGGKIIVVSSTLPNVGIGKLHKRNDQGVVNTPKETSQLLSCQDGFYKSFPIDCSKAQITVDMFLASEDYIDVATVSNLGRFTGGQTHFYPGFSATNFSDVTKFTKEFSKHLSMDICMETVMRARGSMGIRTNGFYGHFFNRSSDLCAFSTMPRDQSYVMELNIEENLVTDYCYLQIAVLLSLNTAQRRIRVITLAIPTTDSLAEIYASADQLAITNVFAQKAIAKAWSSSLQDARELINKSVQDVLGTYKKEIVVSNTAGGAPLRLCANLRMFPLLMHSLTKHTAFRAGILPSDHRASALNFLESVPLPYFIKNIYSCVYSLHDMIDEAGLPDENGSIVLPEPINATSSLFERYGLYLIDNGTELFLWIGGDAVNELIQDVFGTNDIFQIPSGKNEIPVVEGSEFNERVRNIIAKVREHDDVITYQSLYIVRGASVSEPVNHASAREMTSLRLWATSTLVEDKIMGSESYREFLQNVKSKITK